MKTFKDKNNREWVLDVDTNAVRRVRDLAKVDLLKLGTGELFDQLADAVTLVDVLYAICRPEATKASITDEQFGAALVGDAIERATEALLGAVIDFFPSARQPTLRNLVDKGHDVQAAAERAIQSRLAAIDPEKLVAEMVARSTAGNSSTGSPASPVLTPAP